MTPLRWISNSALLLPSEKIPQVRDGRRIHPPGHSVAETGPEAYREVLTAKGDLTREFDLTWASPYPKSWQDLDHPAFVPGKRKPLS